jgi:hypothetical protein
MCLNGRILPTALDVGDAEVFSCADEKFRERRAKFFLVQGCVLGMPMNDASRCNIATAVESVFGGRS